MNKETVRENKETVRGNKETVREEEPVREGDRLPSGHLYVMGAEGPEKVSTVDIFRGAFVLFGLPGAFTSVCSSKQVPEYVARRKDLAAFGAERVFCLSVNDPYVMMAWEGSLAVVPEAITFLADPDASYVRKLGLTQEVEGLGTRARRFSAFVDGGEILLLNVDAPGGKTYKVSGPDNMLRQLREATRDLTP